MTVEAEMEGCCHSPGRLELSEREEVGGSSPRASWGAQPSLHLDFDFWPQSCERMNFSRLEPPAFGHCYGSPRTLLPWVTLPPPAHVPAPPTEVVPWGLSLQSQLGTCLTPVCCSRHCWGLGRFTASHI